MPLFQLIKTVDIGFGFFIHSRYRRKHDFPSQLMNVVSRIPDVSVCLNDRPGNAFLNDWGRNLVESYIHNNKGKILLVYS